MVAKSQKQDLSHEIPIQEGATVRIKKKVLQFLRL